MKLKKLRMLQRRVNLWEKEATRNFIQDLNCSDGYKEALEYLYTDWCRYQGFEYTPRKYKRVHKLPFIPTNVELEQLIAGFRFKYATICRVMKETGASITETLRIRWNDVDLAHQTVVINYPVKGHKTGKYRISGELTANLRRMGSEKQLNKQVFNISMKTFSRNFLRVRKTVAEKMGNPRIDEIDTRTFRHYFGSMIYFKTKDILYTKEQLRHHRLSNTLIYTHLVQFKSDEWTCKVASTLDEAVKLIEAGFEYICEVNGSQLFRKRK
jgi:integrase